MDSGRLQLHYLQPLTQAGGEEGNNWQHGLEHWSDKTYRHPLSMLTSLPWKRAAMLGLAVPLLALAGWVHHHGSTGWHASTPRAHLTPVIPELMPDEPALLPVSPLVDAETTTGTAESVFPSQEPTYWQPSAARAEKHASDHPLIPGEGPVTVKVVTIAARVTAYTPYDHAVSHPSWADGVVAWHPNGRKRYVANHKYCLATDWRQFPPGATYIHVPGYMPKSFPKFPESFRVVDDGCGAARKANRLGQQPVIDVRYMTLHSAIGGRKAWGTRYLDVEVIYPDDFQIPASLQRWVRKVEYRTYDRDGNIIH